VIEVIKQLSRMNTIYSARSLSFVSVKIHTFDFICDAIKRECEGKSERLTVKSPFHCD
jgi:hypothetical protein